MPRPSQHIGTSFRDVRGGRLENADLVPERRNIRPSRGAPIVHRTIDLQFEPGIGLTERPAVVPGVSDPTVHARQIFADRRSFI